jgi:hypothetical protein
MRGLCKYPQGRRENSLFSLSITTPRQVQDFSLTTRISTLHSSTKQQKDIGKGKNYIDKMSRKVMNKLRRASPHTLLPDS